MDTTGEEILWLEGPAGALPIHAQDKLARQLAMLFEGKCLGLGATRAAAKYGYSKQRYYQVLKAFEQGGTAAILPRKTGPKSNSVRTPNVVTQIIRHRFLDPDAGAEVIAQKMRQTGVGVSRRSVERTITEYGLQKKTLQIPSRGRKARD